MALCCICAMAGAYTLQLFSELPGPMPLSVLTGTTLLAFLDSRTRLAGAFVSGFIVLTFTSQAVVNDRLHPDIAGTTISANVRIISFPKDNGASLSFLVEPVGHDELPGRVRLSWFEAPSRPSLGETWQLELRLRRPRGFSNPGGFDYEGWLFRQAIGATGPHTSGLHGALPTLN